MRALAATEPTSDIRVRPGEAADIQALLDLENQVFATDWLTRRGFRRFLASPLAVLLVADQQEGRLAGYALVLFRPTTSIARLYSVAVAPPLEGRGVGSILLAAAEQAARERHCTRLRLEVHEGNARAIARYRKSGYDLFGRHLDYYGDHGTALRFEKRLPPAQALSHAPPYFHQSSEFTCGPACMMMALAWADPSWRPEPALEFKLWREATTIVMASGPAGCEPYGIAVTLKRHGLLPEIHVSQPGPYFLDTVRSEDSRRIVRAVQAEFRREAGALGVPTHLTPLGESALMEAFDSGASAVVLVSGYHMIRRRMPHWVFAFGRQGRKVLLHDPAARRDGRGRALGPETYAVPWAKFDDMMRLNRENLRVALLVRKGPPQ
jgi:ribosomal protein S18 acetylase RimI-like enzyme